MLKKILSTAPEITPTSKPKYFFFQTEPEMMEMEVFPVPSLVSSLYLFVLVARERIDTGVNSGAQTGVSWEGTKRKCNVKVKMFNAIFFLAIYFLLFSLLNTFLFYRGFLNFKTFFLCAFC